MSEHAAETEAPEYATKAEMEELREANKKLQEALEKLETTEPDTAKGKKAEKEVEKAAEEVEEKMEEVGLSEATMDKLADKVADRIAAWADEADADEQEREEKGHLGDLEAGREHKAPREEEPPPPEEKEDRAPGKSEGHWSERRIGRRREE